MTIQKHFAETVEKFNIRLAEIARRSKVEIKATTISRFKGGAINVTTEKLEAMLIAMDEIAPGSRLYFCSRLAGGEELQIDPVTQFDKLSRHQMAELLKLLAQDLQSEQVPSDSFRETAGIMA